MHSISLVNLLYCTYNFICFWNRLRNGLLRKQSFSRQKQRVIRHKIAELIILLFYVECLSFLYDNLRLLFIEGGKTLKDSSRFCGFQGRTN